MPTIATLTMNPTIDVSYEVDRMFHTHKMRTRAERYAPGGGGINVARVFARLGGTARCHYLSGGATGPALDGLIDEHGLDCVRIPIIGPVRIAGAVLERETGKEYRFTPAGPDVTEAEWTRCLDTLAEAACDYLVISGSLPPGVPEDFYARVVRAARIRGVPVVLDSSGAALRAAVAAGGIHLLKPSLGELRQLVGRDIETVEEIARAAQGMIADGRAAMVAVTMGHRGAVLAHAGGALSLPSPEVDARSAVGAGDSFLAAMIHALASGRAPEDAFRRGIAAGAAAVLDPGHDLAHPAEIDRLHAALSAIEGTRFQNI